MVGTRSGWGLRLPETGLALDEIEDDEVEVEEEGRTTRQGPPSSRSPTATVITHPPSQPHRNRMDPPHVPVLSDGPIEINENIFGFRENYWKFSSTTARGQTRKLGQMSSLTTIGVRSALSCETEVAMAAITTSNQRVESSPLAPR